MTPDLFAPAVVLDTSVIRGSGVDSAPFQVLTGLVNAGLVRVYVPELAAQEFRTQWRDRNQSNLSQASRRLKAIANERFVHENIRKQAQKLAFDLAEVDSESLSKDYLDRYFADAAFEIYPISLNQSTEAWSEYFLGNLPSKKVKHRQDIPDAHILAALKEIAAKERETIFVAADESQRQTAMQIEGVASFSGFDDLVKSSQIQPLVSKWKFDQEWKAAQGNLPYDEILEEVKSFVASEGGQILSWEQVTDIQIPEDNHTASIASYGEPDGINISGPEDWGGGILRYASVYFSECLLTFSIFRGDAFDVPDWVSVSIGDIEKDHYLDAEGYAEVLVSVDITVRIKIDSEVEGGESWVQEIAFDTRSLELSLPEFS